MNRSSPERERGFSGKEGVLTVPRHVGKDVALYGGGVVMAIVFGCDM